MSQTIRHEEFFPTQDRVNFCLLFGPSTIWMKLTHIVALPGGSDSKESTCNRGDLGSIPGLGRFPGGEHCNPLQYSSLENSHGQRSLAGYSPRSRKESDITKRLSMQACHVNRIVFRELLDLHHHLRTQQKDGYLWTRNQALPDTKSG